MAKDESSPLRRVASDFSLNLSWMGFAMRRARLFPMVIVGLASLTSQTMMLPECRGWEYVHKDLLNAPQDDSDSVIIDSSVEQAGFYDSRPRPATGKQSM